MSSPELSAVVVLAAGAGTRMRSTTPKVLHRIGGRTLLGHVLAAARPLTASRTAVVVGVGRDEVIARLAEIDSTARAVVQEEQRGTGHATRVALEQLRATGTVLVINGDSPLLRPETLAALVAEHVEHDATMTVLTARVADPAGLGRIVRDGSGAATAIVEHADADAGQLAIDEINAGVYVVDAGALTAALTALESGDVAGSGNAQGELYLTDALGLFVAEGRTVRAHRAADPADIEACNDRAELAARARTLNDRILLAHMRAGVAILDPATTWIDVDVQLEADCTIRPGTQLHGATTVAAGAEIGPDTTLSDCMVGVGARVVRSHATGAEIGPGAQVGPFTYLRPGTRLGADTKAGAFVEMKNAELGTGSKVPHLSYVGDATIGEHSNIGAASVTVNYDGVAKHRTTIGSHARTGADNMFVAPVTVGDGAYTAAGSVIVDDVPPGAMGVARAKQRNVTGWVSRRRAGTPAAEAAQAAAENDQEVDS